MTEDRILEVSNDLMAVLRSVRGPVAHARWTQEPVARKRMSCPLCGSNARVAMSVADLDGEVWHLLDCFACGPHEGGIRRAPSARAQVRPAGATTTHMLCQTARDHRWWQTVEILSEFSVEAAGNLVRELLAMIEVPDAPGVACDRIGGGLHPFDPSLTEAPIFLEWEGQARWRALCLLDVVRVRPFLACGNDVDLLLAGTDAQTGTGVWRMD